MHTNMKQNLWGYFFIGPFIIGFLALQLFLSLLPFIFRLRVMTYLMHRDG